MFDISIWLCCAVLDCALFAVMTKRDLYREFPRFYRYLIFKITVRHALLFGVYTYLSPTAYYWAYWASAGVAYGLLGFAISEAFLFEDEAARIWLTCVLFAVAIGIIIAPPASRDPFMAIVRSLEKAIMFTIAGLYLWSTIDRPVFRSYAEIGLALGLTIYSLVTIVTSILLTTYPAFREVARQFGPVSYAVCASIWLSVFSRYKCNLELFTHSHYILLLHRLKAVR